MPFSIIGSTTDVTTKDGRVVKGREYLWGVAEGETESARRLRRPTKGFLHPAHLHLYAPVENDDHCDFRKLRSLLLRVHMLDLVTTTEETHYEAYRQAQMETRKFGEPKVKKLDNPKFKEEEELLRKRFTEQVKMEEARFRQWEQHVSCCTL
jgi:cell division control protein 12